MSSPKLLAVSCEPGEVAVGGGAGLLGASSSSGVALVVSAPTSDPPMGWIAIATDTDGSNDASWGLRVGVWCASSAPGLERAFSASATDSEPYKFATESCPAGKFTVAAGASVIGPTASSVALHALYPDPGTDTWTAGAHEVQSDPEPWNVRVDLLCAPAAPPLRFRSEITSLSQPHGAVESSCGPGWLPLAGGLETTLPSAGTMTTLRPNAVVGQGITWASSAGEPDPSYSGTAWALRTTVICHRNELFADGFETGAAMAWSVVFP